MFKRFDWRSALATAAAVLLIGFFGDLHAQTFPPYVTGTITTQNLNPATGVATTGSTVTIITNDNASGIAIQVTGTYTGALSVQVSNDSVNWVTLAAATAITNAATGTAAATIPSATPGVYYCTVPGVSQTRVSALAAVTGTATVSVRTTRGSKIN